MANQQRHKSRFSQRYDNLAEKDWLIGRQWDLYATVIILGLIVLLSVATKNMSAPYHPGVKIAINLQPSDLPYYALRTTTRMLIALIASIIMTFIFATWAAKSSRAERIIIPAIDVLQSVPVLSFLTITVPAFMFLFPNSMLGPECAAIFAIFTAQVWNMALSFYQSLTNIPKEWYEVADSFHLSAWQKFWRIEAPYAMPGLLWNAMMSMSGSWVFLIAAEAFTVAGQKIALPGIGSYIALAISKADQHAIIYAIITMILVIFLYDQLLFRPLVVWSEKFKNEITASDAEPHSWIYHIFVRSQLFKRLNLITGNCGDFLLNNNLLLKKHSKKTSKKNIKNQASQKIRSWVYDIIIITSLGITASILGIYLLHNSNWHQAANLIQLGSLTATRVICLIILCSLIWLPIGVWVGLRPRLTKHVQVVAQFLAAFPVNLLFPFIVTAIIHYHLDVNYWSAPLMVLGTQWYILFNVIAGTSVIPNEQLQAATVFKVRGWLWWRRIILPSIFPYYITGAITAAGGAWNMSIIAEALNWGQHKLYAQGLGAAITKAASSGNIPQLTLATIIMSLFVILINRILWKPLYKLASERYGTNR